MRLKRVMIALSLLLMLGALLGSLGLWIFLSKWVPVTGKARLIQELERVGPVTVSIGEMRYELLRGLVLKQVTVVDRASQETWLSSPLLSVHVGWAGLVLRQPLAFRVSASVESPCATQVFVSGRYHLRDGSLALDIRTEEIRLRSVTGPLARALPPELADGGVRVRLKVKRPAQAPPLLTGEVIGTKLLWATPTWRLSGDLTVEGEGRPPTQRGAPWSFQGRTTLRDATLTGLAGLGPITGLHGRARLSADRVEVETLTGVVLSSPWDLEGLVTFKDRPSIDVLLSSHAALGPIVEALPKIRDAWQPKGTADLRAVCRGAIQEPPLLDCLAHAILHDTTLQGAKLIHPLTEINGDLDFDWLTRQLSIETLTGRIATAPFRVAGEINTAVPSHMALHVSGMLPLEALAPWLPPEPPISQLGGTAALDLDMEGTGSTIHATGEVELREATAWLATPAVLLEGVTGLVRLTPDRMEIVQATLSVNNQAMTVTATATPPPLSGEAIPSRIIATVSTPPAQLKLTCRVEPETVVVEEGRLSLARSRMTLTGTVSRAADHPSTLELAGAVELADLPSIPFVTLPALEGWRLQGAAEVNARFQGRMADWPGATLQGRLMGDAVKVREVPINQLLCVVEQRDRILRLRVPSALVAGGKLAAELAVEHDARTHNYLLQADVIGLQLARLSDAIPAWRARSITGAASAHATLAGTWETRATWRGDGWVNVSGERLGDIPLLEKVFRGLFGVLADRLGLELLRRAQITQASVQWQLANERLSTEDLRLAGLAGTEPVALYAKGSVGLDRTLDFVIEPELSEGVVLQSPTTSTLASAILRAAGQLERLRRLIGRHRLTGTLNDPEYRFELTTHELLKQLSPGAGELLQQLFDAVR